MHLRDMRMHNGELLHVIISKTIIVNLDLITCMLLTCSHTNYSISAWYVHTIIVYNVMACVYGVLSCVSSAAGTQEIISQSPPPPPPPPPKVSILFVIIVFPSKWFLGTPDEHWLGSALKEQCRADILDSPSNSVELKVWLCRFVADTRSDRGKYPAKYLAPVVVWLLLTQNKLYYVCSEQTVIIMYLLNKLYVAIGLSQKQCKCSFTAKIVHAP